MMTSNSADSSEEVFHRASTFEAMALMAVGGVIGAFYAGYLMEPPIATATFAGACVFALAMMVRRWGWRALV